MQESRINNRIIHDPAYNLPFARDLKKLVDITVILVGGINSLGLVEEIVNERFADFIVLLI